MILCRAVMGIKWECLYKMPAIILPTNVSFLCAYTYFPSASLYFVLVLFAN